MGIQASNIYCCYFMATEVIGGEAQPPIAGWTAPNPYNFTLFCMHVGYWHIAVFDDKDNSIAIRKLIQLFIMAIAVS